MKYWTINVWEFTPEFSEQNDIHINSLKEDHYDCVIIFCQGEVTFGSRLYRLNDIINIAKEKKIKMYAIIGCDPYIFNPTFETLTKDVEIQWWPTYFLHSGVKGFGKEALEQGPENFIVSNLDNLNYKYHYVCLNNRFNVHRSMMIDELAKNNLLKYSAYSWHGLKYWEKSFTEIKVPPKHASYEFKYYDGSVKKLDGGFITPRKTRFPLPSEYYQSFFQLVPESMVNYKFITEKTTAPLLIGKPFMVLGAPGIHQMIKDLGFELYDELFDYSFDTIQDLNQRVTAISENIKRITNLSLDECRNFHSKIQSKIDHNRKRVIEIAYDQNFIPKAARWVIQHYHATGEILDKHTINCNIGLSDIRKIAEKYV